VNVLRGRRRALVPLVAGGFVWFLRSLEAAAGCSGVLLCGREGCRMVRGW